jgi:hypothetical protein
MVLEVYKGKLVASAISESAAVFVVDRSSKQSKLIMNEFECVSMCPIPNFDLNKIPFILIRSRDKVSILHLRQGNMIQVFKQNYFDNTS